MLNKSNKHGYKTLNSTRGINGRDVEQARSYQRAPGDPPVGVIL
jgi:hypothetical protein